MHSKRRSRPGPSSKAVARVTFFGPPPILPEEDLKAYGQLLASVTAHVKPTSIIEEIWVRDVVDLTWEILRWRRIKMGLVSQRIAADQSISMDAAFNSAFIRELTSLERIDRLAALAESRRNAVLREIERHRAVFAQLLRDKVQDVQDAEFETIEPKAISQNDTGNNEAA